MSPWERLLENPQSRGHFLQLYRPGDYVSLVRNVGIYLSEGLVHGEGGLVIAEADHRAVFLTELQRLGNDTEAAIREHRLVLLDAREMLAEFMDSGQPDWDLFERSVGAALARVHSVAHPSCVRAYGGMVGLLWNARQHSAAARLEQFWNRLLTRFSFSLFCSYSIDVLDKGFQGRTLDAILSTHTHFLPSGSRGDLEAALQSAMDTVLEGKAERIRALIRANYKPGWAVMPYAESAILWLRRNLPEQAEQIVSLMRDKLRPQPQPA